MKKSIYLGIVIASLSWCANDIKSSDKKLPGSKELSALKPNQTTITTSVPSKEVTKKKQYYPRGTIATH